MKQFKAYGPFNISAHLLIPTETMVKGVKKKTYSQPTENDLINISFKTYGGTESVENGIYSLVDTATVTCWYRPDIKANCRLKLTDDDSEWEIIGRPEDIDRRHQYLQFKVQSVNGGA